MIRASYPLMIMVVLGFALACSGSDEDDSTATATSDGATGGGAASAEAESIEVWTNAFCVGYGSWIASSRPSDGVNPASLELEARTERAKAHVQAYASETEALSDLLSETDPPISLTAYRETAREGALSVLDDLDRYQDDPPQTIEDLQNLGLSIQRGVESMQNSIETAANSLQQETRVAFNAALDGNSDCAAVPRATMSVVGDGGDGPLGGREYPRPNIEQLECGPLLTFDDVDPVLGTTDWLTISGGESCTHLLLDDNTTFVRIQPGHPTDLIDAALEGAAGEPVQGVGDAAIWFSEAGTLSVATDSRFGIVVFRVTVARDELDEPALLEAAKALALAALPRFPGIDAPPPPPPEEMVVTIEHEPADQADQTYVANLLAREAEGDWTRAEGLIATLRLFVGEATASQVTPARTIAEQSATGIVRMARAYVEASGDTDEAAELERLLGLMLPSNLRAGEATASARRSSSLAITRTTSQEPSGECISVWPEHGDPCFMISNEIVPEFGDKYRIAFPDLDEWEGWTRGPSSPISEAIRKTARFLEGRAGESPQIDVVLGPLNASSTVVLDQGRCQIVLNKGAQLLRDVDPALLQQAVASAMASCYLEHSFGYSESWELAASYYLSDIVYPAASMETVVLKIPDSLRGEELRTTLTERQLTNMPFFEHVDSARGVDGAIDAYGAIVGGGPAAIGGIDELWHEHSKALTDGVIVDQAGTHRFVPGARRFDASPGLRIKAEPRAFGLERVQLSVPSGMYACMEYPDGGNLDLTVSWRPGSPGDSGGWSTSLPESLDGTSVFLITAGEADGRFDLKVREVEDNPECEEEKDEDDGSGGTPDPPCGFCDPTSFYYDSVEDWLTAIAKGR